MLEITLLGEQRVTADDRSVEELRSPRTLGLLAYLVVHAGAPQLRAHLAGVFWPDSTDPQARTNLRRELHRLRGCGPLVDGCLEVDARAVSWRADSPGSVDVIDFRRAADEADAALAAGERVAFQVAAERAVRAYGGDLLPGFYDDWVAEERERLRRTCVSLLDRLVASLAESDAAERSVPLAHRRVELEPLEEAGYRTLMSLQARTGDRAAALRTFHRCSSILERELQVEPSQATREAHERLLVRSGGRQEVASEPVAEQRSIAPLVGRSDELAALRQVWDASAHVPRMVVVAGEAGVGKTRLVAELADAIAQGGGAVARARCFASEARVALAPVAEWLRSPALRPGSGRLDPAWRGEVARLLPELRTEVRPGGSAALTDAWQRRQFLEGLAQAVLAVDRPVLLVLDDLQWCDEETLSWLEVLLRHRPDPPLLIVGTARSEEVDDHPALLACCRRLRVEGCLDDLELDPLSGIAAAELAARLRGAPLDDAGVRRLQTQTGGFPLLIVESLRQDEASPSRRVDAVLSQRLELLSAAADEVVGVAAAVGRDFSLELLAAACDLDEDTLVGAVDELWRRRLLREHSAATYDFAHDLLRDAAYARLTPPQRQRLHRRLADALARLHGHDLEAVAAQLAEQHERGGQRDRAVHFHTLAAAGATAILAADVAVRHYRRALELLGGLPQSTARDRRELELREAMVPPLLAGRGYADPDIGATLARTVHLGEVLGEAGVVLRSQVGRWAHLFVQGRVSESLALTERYEHRVDEHPALTGQLCLAHAGSLTSVGRAADALAWFDRVEAEAARDETWIYGFPLKVMSRGWRAHALWLVGRGPEAAASAEAAVDLAEASGHPFGQVVAQAYGALTHLFLDDVELSGALAASVRRLCDHHGFAYYGEWARIVQGHLTGGAAGEAKMRQGIEALRHVHSGARMPFWLFLLATELTEAGRVREARRVLAEARGWAEQGGDRWWLAELWRRDAATGPAHRAADMLQRALTVASEQQAVGLELRAATDLARHHGDVEAGEAERVLAEVRARADGCNPADLAAADALLSGVEDPEAPEMLDDVVAPRASTDG